MWPIKKRVFKQFLLPHWIIYVFVTKIDILPSEYLLRIAWNVEKCHFQLAFECVCVWNPGQMVPGKNGPRKNCPRKMVPVKLVPRKMVPENWSRKNGPRKIGPRKLVPGKVRNEKSWVGGRASWWCVCVSGDHFGDHFSGDHFSAYRVCVSFNFSNYCNS